MAQISVLVTAYNVEAFIEEAVCSLLSQTLRDIEIVVVDDGSTDRTPQILKGLAQRDPRLRIVSTGKNTGIPSALNFGLSFCRSPYIARLDGDDVAVPDRLEKQLDYLERNPAVALVGSATITITEDGRKVSVSRVPVTEEEIQQTLLLASPCYQVWLARREVYDTLSGYRHFPVVSDYDFLLRAVTAGFRLANLAEPLTRVRKRAGNTADVAALKIRKAHVYVVRLHRERLRTGRDSDSFTSETCALELAVGPIERVLHGYALKASAKAFDTNSRVLRTLCMGFSALVSPWQALYLADRIRLRLALRNSSSQDASGQRTGKARSKSRGT